MLPWVLIKAVVNVRGQARAPSFSLRVSAPTELRALSPDVSPPPQERVLRVRTLSPLIVGRGRLARCALHAASCFGRAKVCVAASFSPPHSHPHLSFLPSFLTRVESPPQDQITYCLNTYYFCGRVKMEVSCCGGRRKNEVSMRAREKLI